DILGSSGVPLNTWTHLAATYDGNVLALYVNGTQVATQIVAGAITTTTGALRIGGNNIWGEWFSGLIDEVRVYNRALTAAQIQSDMTKPVGTPDTTPPSAPGTLTATGGRGAASLSWGAATDATGVAGVQFKLDGNNLGSEDTTAPYSVSWDTHGAANGTHTLTATARDLAGNTATSAGVQVTVSNTTPPSGLVEALAFDEGSGTTTA